MALTRWSPMGEMTRMREEMDRLFDRFFAPMERRMELPETFMATGWVPSIDMYDRNGDLVVEAELPGIKKEDVDISVEDSTLTIRGEMKREEEKKEEGLYRSERHYGRFVRSIPLPTSVKSDQVKAKFEHGVLCITLPKAEEVRKGKKIVVE
ncbi:MAG: Hsp20/alpha crystallin family protein [Armatimonadetes bacterium]|nr:Hsp20/alpha crystallin family protein [Armatimonadota bacterium]